MDYTAARGRREAANAGLAELKLDTERGLVVSVAAIERLWASRLTDLRARLLAIPARVTDLAQLDGEIRAALTDIADAATQ